MTSTIYNIKARHIFEGIFGTFVLWFLLKPILNAPFEDIFTSMFTDSLYAFVAFFILLGGIISLAWIVFSILDFIVVNVGFRDEIMWSYNVTVSRDLCDKYVHRRTLRRSQNNGELRRETDLIEKDIQNKLQKYLETLLKEDNTIPLPKIKLSKGVKK